MKSKQTQIDAQGKAPLGMKILETRALLKALAAAEESLGAMRQSLLIARAQPTARSAPWPQFSNDTERAGPKADLKHQIENPMQ